MESADEFNNCEWRDDNACDETLSGACGRCTDCRDCNNCPYCEATRLRVDDDYWCWFVGDGTCDEVAGGWCPSAADGSDSRGVLVGVYEADRRRRLAGAAEPGAGASGGSSAG